MSVLAIVVALLAEQWRPLDSRRTVQPVLEAWAGWLEHAFNGGEKSHGMVAWLAAVLPPAAAAIAIHHLLASVHFLLAAVFNIAVLYFTLGFRQFSHHFTQLPLREMVAEQAEDQESGRA